MKLAKKIASAFLALSLCMGLPAPAFAANTVELHEDGGVFGQYTVKLTGVLSQQEMTIEWGYGNDLCWSPERPYTATAYTVSADEFTFSETVVDSEGDLNDYENSPDLRNIIALKKGVNGWTGYGLEHDHPEGFALTNYQNILKPAMDEYDMFYMASGAGDFFIILDGEISTVPGDQFTDVAPKAYYYDAVKWALDKGITSGTSATTFSPNSACTTAQILTFLWRANGSPEPAKASAFTNVPADAYYAKAAAWAAEKGLISGTTFDGNAPCTRIETVSYLWKLAGKPGSILPSAFMDVPKGTDEMKAVTWAVEQGITVGTGRLTFSPNDSCTRGEIVTFIYRDITK